MARSRPILRLPWLALAGLLPVTGAASASDYVVTNLSDSGATFGSLRWAVIQANNHANSAGDPSDTITFDPAFFDVPRTITLTNGQLGLIDTSGATIIEGPGEDLLTISGDHAHRVFLVDELFNGTTMPGPPDVVVEIRDLTIADGEVGTNVSGSSGTPFGGGIHSSGNLTLTRVTFRGNRAHFVLPDDTVVAFGGAVFNYRTLVVSDCTFDANTAHAETANLFADAYGAGIYNWPSGTMTVTGSTFTGNVVETVSPGGDNDASRAGGAGIYNGGVATLAHCSFTGNSVDAGTFAFGPAVAHGGGVYSTGPLTSVTGCVFSANTINAHTNGFGDAEALGGGLKIEGDSTVTDTIVEGNTAAVSDTQTGDAIGGGVFTGDVLFKNCRIEGNTASAVTSANAEAFGGGLFGSGVILDCSVSRNVATATATLMAPSFPRGGGIYTGGDLSIRNSTVAGNVSVANGFIGIALGGAIFQSVGGITVANSTIAANSAHSEGTSYQEVRGGGIFGSATFANTVLTGNTVSAVGATPTLSGPNLEGNAGSLGSNLVGDTSGSTGFGGSDLTGVAATSVFEDVDESGVIDADDLVDHGGPTDTLALEPGGPAIDAGDDALIPDDPDTTMPVTSDQRGAGFPRIVGPAVDIGAYEAPVGPGVPFCFGSGCPCGNDSPASGCLNSTGAGAVLTGSGSASVAADDLVLTTTGCPPDNTGLYFMGGSTFAPVFVGDGLACTGGIWRYFPGVVDGSGVFIQASPVANAFVGAIHPGDTRHFQSWTRDVLCGPPPAPCASPCGNNSNLSNGYSVVFTP